MAPATTGPGPEDVGRPRRYETAELSAAQLAEIRGLMDAAFGDGDDERFGDDDSAHALGGTHVIVEVRGRIATHASVVEREIHVDGRPLRTGYVEAVATAPDLQGRGLGSIAMREVNAIIDEGYELGMLGTGRHHFYERLGWRTWHGPAFVRTDAGLVRTPAEEGFLLVLETPATPPLDLATPISCNWRPGDVW